MYNEPIVIAAIISGTVSLVVSGITGFYIILQNKKRFAFLRKEIITKASTETFVKSKESYLNTFRSFEPALISINKRNPHDGLEALQFIIDFYTNSARDYYLRNKQFLETKQLNNLFENISKFIESDTLNNRDNHSEKREFGNTILKFVNVLHEQSLLVN